MSVVAISNLHKSFGSLKVLDGVSLAIARGEMVAIIGRSGSGKSTLLRCVNGLEPFQQGEVTVADHTLRANTAVHAKPLQSLRQDVGMVFQSYNLFPHLTVERNITLGQELVRKTAPDQAKEIARRVLRQVGLEDKIAAWPDQLSGGQQQRVAIARSLAMNPRVMLFDEVTSALDPELTKEVLRVMEALSRDGMTMMLVTHEMAFARRAASRVVFMHQGRIWEEGPPAALFEHPRTPELAQFLEAVL
jgi:polar amino acid transport system ATP-binding protein